MEHQVITKDWGDSLRVSHDIYFKITNPKSRASYLMMVDDYFKQDLSNTKSYAYRMKWIQFSRDFLTRHLNKWGNLYCTYCGKGDLRIELTTSEKKVRKRDRKNVIPSHEKATIDHIDPKSKGGAIEDPKNITICCEKCNGKKGSSSVLAFLGYKSK